MWGYLTYLMVMLPNISEGFYVFKIPFVKVFCQNIYNIVNILASKTLTNGIDPDQMSFIKMDTLTCFFMPFLDKESTSVTFWLLFQTRFTS